MKCPFCGHQENKVVDSRLSHAGDITRRRRECLSCNSRFTTYERVEELMPLVIKKDGRREEFVREKILEGVQIACRKRPFAAADLEDMVREVELKIQALGVREIPSREIGEFVMDTLRKRDKVAYIRFASVYREFNDVEDFLTELQKEHLSADSSGQSTVN
jgi:transcriptional repressor NrdR